MEKLSICSTCKYYGGRLDDLNKIFDAEMLGVWKRGFVFCKSDKSKMIGVRQSAETLRQCDDWEVCNNGYHRETS